jgi:hypothetical protein
MRPPRRRERPAEALVLAVLALEAQFEAIKKKQEQIDARLQQLQQAAEAAAALMKGMQV